MISDGSQVLFKMIEVQAQYYLFLNQMSDEMICPKHNQMIAYICTFDGCTNRRLCEQCKNKDNLHFSQHATHIYRLKDFHDFHTSKDLIPKLQRGIQDSQNYINTHKTFYQEQIRKLNSDFQVLAQIFKEIHENYKQIYTTAFLKQMNKFDNNLMDIKTLLKQYVYQKNEQQSFFSRIFGGNESQNMSVDDIVKKHQKIFQVRANIISIRSNIAIAKSNKTCYKSTTNDHNKFDQLKDYFKQFQVGFYDKLKELLNNDGTQNSLKNSIVSQSRSLSGSQVSQGSALSGSQVSLNKHQSSGNVSSPMKKKSSSQKSLSMSQIHQSRVRVALPQPHPSVLNIMKMLKSIQYPSKLPMLAKTQNMRQQGPFKYPQGTYLGTYLQGLRYGTGIFIYGRDGSYYQGTWEDDKMWGYGRLITESSYYQGQIANGVAHGAGTYQNAFKVYSGQWRHDQRHGNGEETYKNRRFRYRGSFANDKYSGAGLLQEQDFTYNGHFKDGVFQGEGSLRWKNGQTFVGHFKGGQKLRGRHVIPDGSYYQGQYQGGVPCGRGQFKWSDGVKYIGNWKNGVQQGEGLQCYDGKQNKGLWKNGKFVLWM